MMQDHERVHEGEHRSDDRQFSLLNRRDYFYRTTQRNIREQSRTLIMAVFRVVVEVQKRFKRSLPPPSSQRRAQYFEEKQTNITNLVTSETSANFYQTTRRNNPEDRSGVGCLYVRLIAAFMAITTGVSAFSPEARYHKSGPDEINSDGGILASSNL
ncbi:hypothetical protein L798_00890 [Zootermopsis nevadensis]|uniref:Uncharacterized protein n=1 Tax=Zootermopsis nevadensis TaxID=136037 RepID=A0A067QJ54_ZOONE|nr:hypothetical protein L798_00890 [Zootermopsis nevadensis]